MFLFGLHTDEIANWRAHGYDPNGMAKADPELYRVCNKIMNGFSDGKSYSDIISTLLFQGDPYMVIADFRKYSDTQERLYKTIADPSEMGRLSLMNTALSGYFAADRAIREYAENIWHIN